MSSHIIFFKFAHYKGRDAGSVYVFDGVCDDINDINFVKNVFTTKQGVRGQKCSAGICTPTVH